MSIRVSRTRRLRHESYGRVRRRKRLISWLKQQGTRLLASATGLTVTPVVAYASGVLTSSANYANTETVTINGKVYTFQTVLTNVDGNVFIGASEAASLTNLANAINGSGGTPGTDYAALTTAHPTVTAATGTHTVTVTAKTAGSAGNALTTTETSATAAWGGATLTGGLTSNNLNATAHGLADDAGPFRVSSSGTIPLGLSASADYWVRRVTANALQLTSDPDSDYVLQVLLGPGSGTITLTRPADAKGMFDLLRRNKPRTVQAATDIDNLN